jgi:cobalt/nickel transport system permease protein
MSHIHLPDGILPTWLWLSGYVLTALVIAVLWRGGKATADPRRFALLGIFGASMILVMMIEIPPFSFHFNLSVVTGIILGPQLAILASLIVNLILSLIGHGGITVVGLNTLVLSVEMLAGYYVFRLLTRARMSLSRAGFVATVIGLALGTAVGFGIIALGSPWINHVLQSASLRPGEELPPGIEGAHLSLSRLALIMFGVGAVGWVLEGMLSAAILRYIARVYPELVSEE